MMKNIFLALFTHLLKKKFAFLSICFVFLLLASSFSTHSSEQKNIISISYMDQVVRRKKNLIERRCKKHRLGEKGFMMIELKVSHKGGAKARMVSTDLKDKIFIQCSLSVLNRIQFKKFDQGFVTRIYRFFIL